MSRIRRMALAAWMACAAAGADFRAEPGRARLDPDPRTRAAIEETVSAIVRNDDAVAERFSSLQRIGERDRGALLLQLAIFLESAGGAEESMAGASLLQALSFTPKERIDAVVPRLEDAGPELRRVFAGILAGIDRRDGGEADFGVYDAWLAGRGGRPPSAFVAYLYEAAPDEAVALMQRVYGRAAPPAVAAIRALEDLKRIAAGRDASRGLNEKDRSRASAALETLAADPAWWVRRYAAAFLRDDAALGIPAVTERLKADPEPLVRDVFVP